MSDTPRFTPRTWEADENGKVPAALAETMEKELQDCHATIHKLRTALRRMIDAVEGDGMKNVTQEAKDLL